MNILCNGTHTTLYLYFISLIICSKSFRVFSNRLCKAYRQHYLKDSFTPVQEEKTLYINHTDGLFNKLSNSFFAQIGSNPKYVEDEDYHWFDGDGMIHGVFINKSQIVYQNKWVQTKRFQVENKWKKKMYLYFGELKGFKGLYEILKFSLMELLGFLPHAKGTANTAMLHWNGKFYALHEGDMPYELIMDYKKFNISTKGRLNFTNIYSTTAHPIQDKKRKQLYLYGYNNYDFSDGKFIFNAFSQNLTHLYQRNFSLINNGMTHDVAFTGDNIIIPDMPLKYDPSLMCQEKLPLYFDKQNGITRFGVYNVECHIDSNKTCEPHWFYFDENFFIFHFARAYQTVQEYIVFACVMDDLHMEDFVELKSHTNEQQIIRGKLRLKQLTLHKYTNKTSVVENPFLENLELDFPYNLDFPIQSKINPRYIYCSVFDSSTGYIRGYVKVDTYYFDTAKPQVFLFHEGNFGNSEPQVVILENKEYLISYTYNSNDSYISLIDVEHNSLHSIKIPTRIPTGFHSIYFKH